MKLSEVEIEKLLPLIDCENLDFDISEITISAVDQRSLGSRTIEKHDNLRTFFCNKGSLFICYPIDDFYFNANQDDILCYAIMDDDEYVCGWEKNYGYIDDLYIEIGMEHDDGYGNTQIIERIASLFKEKKISFNEAKDELIFLE